MVHKAHVWSASLIHEAIRSLERWIADCDNQNMAALQREKGKREDHRSQWKDLRPRARIRLASMPVLAVHVVLQFILPD